MPTCGTALPIRGDVLPVLPECTKIGHDPVLSHAPSEKYVCHPSAGGTLCPSVTEPASYFLAASLAAFLFSTHIVTSYMSGVAMKRDA